MAKWNEETFFARAASLPQRTQDALRLLYALKDAPRIQVDFGEGNEDVRFKIFLLSAGGGSVLMPQADGQLFLPFWNHRDNKRVVGPLEAITRSYFELDRSPKWPYNKEYVEAAVWVPKVTALVDRLERLALELDEPGIPPSARPPTVRRGAIKAPASEVGPSIDSVTDGAAQQPETKVVEPVAPDTTTSPSSSVDQFDGELDAGAPPDDPEILETWARRARRGQPQFRDALMRAYEESCCISGDGPRAVLEAAHIDGHAASGDNRLDNGLLLRADLHVLFDVHLLLVDPDSLRVKLAPELRETTYWQYEGTALRTPALGNGPSPDKLRRRLDLIRPGSIKKS